MLPKKERLSRNEFNRFFSVGKRIHTPSFLLVYTPYPTLHVSIVVSKKIYKSAVKRNKLRRRIYDMVRRYRQDVGISGVYIFILNAGVVNKKPSDIQQDISTCLHTLT